MQLHNYSGIQTNIFAFKDRNFLNAPNIAPPIEISLINLQCDHAERQTVSNWN